MNRYGGSYSSVTLERMKFGAVQVISEELTKDFAIPPRIDLERDIFRGIAIHVRQDVLAQHLDRTKVSYPATWWQACKAALYHWLQHDHWPWGGDYAARRWPVKEQHISIDVKALYPKIALPDHRPIVTVLREQWREDA